MYNIFVVDFLHEVELGVWKAMFTHLIRLLYAHDADQVHELNRRYIRHYSIHIFSLRPESRYRMVPTFGRGTIRRFSNNVSEMKKLAARDFEDILQV
jgi:hypothetical protein